MFGVTLDLSSENVSKLEKAVVSLFGRRVNEEVLTSAMNSIVCLYR